MITYLTAGWYTDGSPRRLQDAVVDGAIDSASMFFRAAVPPQAVSSLALRLRTLAALVDAPHRRRAGPVTLSASERQAVCQRLQMYTDRFPALQSFILDALEAVHNAAEMRALYLHLIHIGQMMQLLVVAKVSDVAGSLGLSTQTPYEVAGGKTAGTSSEHLCPAALAALAQSPLGKPTTRHSRASSADKKGR